MKTVKTIIDGHEIEVPEHLMPTVTEQNAFFSAIAADEKRKLDAHDDLVAALNSLMTMDVKGHQLQDRLQFSDKGRALLDQCKVALAKAGAI